MTRSSIAAPIPRIGSGAGTERLCLIFVVLLFSCYAVILFLHNDVARMQDYSDWTYEGVMLHDTMIGHPPPNAVLKHYPVPNSLETVGIALLCFVFPAEFAAKVWILIYLVLTILVSFYLYRSWEFTSPLLWLVVPAIFVGLDFWWGFISFLLGVLWVMLLTGMLLRGISSRWKYAAVLVLAFFTHMVPFSVGLLLLFCFGIERRRYSLLWQALPGVLLTIWYALGRYLLGGNADGHAGMVATVRYLSMPFWAFKVNTYLKSFDFVNPATAATGLLAIRLGDAIFLLLFLLNLVTAGSFAYLIFISTRRAVIRRSEARFFWIAFAMTLPVIVLLPGEALGISDPGVRVLQSVLWPSLWLCTGNVRLLRIAAATAVVFSCLNVWLWSTFVFAAPSPVLLSGHSRLPSMLSKFGQAQYSERYEYYEALRRGDMSLPVWPTGMFRPAAPSPP